MGNWVGKGHPYSRLIYYDNKYIAKDWKGKKEGSDSDFADLINATIQNVVNDGGGTIRLRAKTNFALSDTIDIPTLSDDETIVLEGEGWTSEIKLNNAVNKEMILSGAGKTYGQIVIRNLSLDGNRTNQTVNKDALVFQGCDRPLVEGLRIRYVKGTGIMCKYYNSNSLIQPWILKNHILDCDNNCIDLNGPDALVSGNDIGQCAFTGGDGALRIGSGGCCCSIVNNNIWGSKVGLYIYRTGQVSLAANRIDYNKREGAILNECKNISWSGGTVYENSKDNLGTYSGIKIISSNASYKAEGIIIQGVWFGKIGATATHKYCIEESGNQVDNNIYGPNVYMHYQQSEPVNIVGASTIYIPSHGYPHLGVVGVLRQKLVGDDFQYMFKSGGKELRVVNAATHYGIYNANDSKFLLKIDPNGVHLEGLKIANWNYLQWKDSGGALRSILGLDNNNIVRLTNPVGYLYLGVDMTHSIEIGYNSSGNVSIGGGSTKPATVSLDAQNPILIKKDLDLEGKMLRDMKEHVDAQLSGTPKIIEVKDAAGTSYYFKVYPTKA